MAQLFGRATIAYDGITLPSLPGAQIKVGGIKRKEIVLDNGTVGYVEEPTAAGIECEVASTASAEDLHAIVGAVVTFREDTGRTWLVRNAFCVEPPELKGGDGKFKLKLSGNPAEQA